MDYSKIKLDGERNSHVTKRLNRLNTWQFFKVLYRENIWRLFGFSFLMILCMVPIFILVSFTDFQISNLQSTLPLYGDVGFSTGVWQGVGDYYAQQATQTRILYGLCTLAGSLVCSFIFSGGFAVIRDAFWTGKLSAVGVFRSFGKGIKANFGYALLSSFVIGSCVYGISVFVSVAQLSWPTWLWIILMILMIALSVLIAIYMLILCSVTVTYKQSVAQNFADAWRLMWLNILPNILRLVIALIPLALYFLFSGSALQSLILVLLFMFGGMYFPLVWQTFMMKTFALFHPIEAPKKGKKSKAQRRQTAEITEDEGMEQVETEQTEQPQEGDSQQPAVAN